MRSILSQIWRELSRPSAGRSWYEWATMALGHVMLGALAAELLAFFGAPASLGVALVIATLYFLAKETRDLRSGAPVSDSVTDAAFVMLGGLSPLPGWTLAAWGAVSLGVILRVAREGGSND